MSAPFMHDCDQYTFAAGHCYRCGVRAYRCECGQDMTEHDQECPAA